EHGRLLAALLHVRPHEVLGVGLEHAVDLVEQVVELLLERLSLLGRRGVDLFGLGRPLLGRRPLLLLPLRHGSCLPPRRPQLRTPTTRAVPPARPASCTR